MGCGDQIGEFHLISSIEATAGHTNAQIQLPESDRVAGRLTVRSGKGRVTIRRLQDIRRKIREGYST